ncbi:MAG: response regulator [Bacteroidales bacterium]|nr:response regulator [Bacteroidales bacterium]
MSSKTILIIDDSNTNLVLLESLFKRKGYLVHSASNAKEGLEILEKEPPDLLYLDLVMPEVDGFDFIRILQKNDKWKDIPVVILSAVNEEDVISKSIELGVKKYLTKPLDIEHIISLTESILSN